MSTPPNLARPRAPERAEGTRRRTKVLVVIKGLGLGGAERLLVDALPFLDREHFDYHVGYLLPWKRFLVRELERAGIPVHCLGGAPVADARDGDLRQGRTRSWAALALLPAALRRLLILQRRERFDVIQADLPVAGILARVVGRWSAVPVVYTEHNLQERYHSVTRWINAATYGWNRRVLAVSAEVGASIERSGLRRRTRVVAVPNGVPVELIRSEAAVTTRVRAELNIPDTHLVVGTVAVFRAQKRLDDWLRVASRVVECRPDVTFLLVGGGPLEPAVRARIEALGLTPRVRTPGFRPDGRRLMSVMDVYLMTSEFEGLPMALLEAMALGKPVVSTAVGGIPDVLQAGTAGLLAPVGAIEALSDGVLRLLADPNLRAQMGRRGAAKVESEHHVRRRVRAIESLYQEVLEEVA
jgi:glycosyltransferase involved in cell wall biosynthesis